MRVKSRGKRERETGKEEEEEEEVQARACKFELSVESGERGLGLSVSVFLTRTLRPITGPQHSYQSLSPRIIHALILVAREHRRLRVGLQTRVASDRGERENVSIFSRTSLISSSLLSETNQAWKKGRVSVFDPSCACRFRVNRTRSNLRIRLSEIFVFSFDNEQIFIATIFVSARFDAESFSFRSSRWQNGRGINGEMFADWPTVRSSGWPLTAAKIEGISRYFTIVLISLDGFAIRSKRS